MKDLKILFASSEVAPFAKTGGLADVSGSLPAALSSLGLQVILIMPLYRSVKEGAFDLKRHDKVLSIPFKGKRMNAGVFSAEMAGGIPIYFIQREEFFDRSGLYGTSGGDYFDNPERFIFFSRSVLEFCRQFDVEPDIVHCHDWQTSLIPVYLKSLYKSEPHCADVRSVFTIHNLAYQGVFPKEALTASELPPELFSMQGLEYYGKMNFMKGGIVFSDVITTVSVKYAQEIQTPEYGYGMDGVLRERKADIWGILNGVDYSLWNPKTDPHIASNYDEKEVAGKGRCKDDLRQVFGLGLSEEFPIVGMISRLADQKGFDILAEAMDQLLKLDLSLVILGTGDAKYEKQFAALAEKHAGRLGVKIAFDNALAHQIEAGSDMFLMPSMYEPCGLNQMYSLKYGTIPVVRATGGLDDTIEEFDPDTGEGTGFKFSAYSAPELVKAVKRALYIYRNKVLWGKLVQNAMKTDFSWAKSAKKYVEIYKKALAVD